MTAQSQIQLKPGEAYCKLCGGWPSFGIGCPCSVCNGTGTQLLDHDRENMSDKIPKNTLTILALISDALERIAATLEAQREDQKASDDPEYITANDIRAARREMLLVYADELGVSGWADGKSIDISSKQNPWIRKRCLEAHAGDDLRDEDD